MILPETFFDAFKYASIGGFVAMIVAALVFIPKNLDRNSDRAARTRKVAVACLAVLASLIVIGFVIEPFGTSLVIVRITPNDVTKTRARFYGSSSYSFQNGHAETLTPAKGTVVVNDTTFVMHLKLETYGNVAAAVGWQFITPTDDAPPMKVTSFDHTIDFIGADEVPPQKVQGVYEENKYWLVW